MIFFQLASEDGFRFWATPLNLDRISGFSGFSGFTSMNPFFMVKVNGGIKKAAVFIPAASLLILDLNQGPPD